MTITEIFGLGHQARGPQSYLALAGAVATLYFCIALQADVLLYSLAALYLFFVLRRLVINPGKGFRLWADRIDVFTPNGLKRVPLDHVHGVSIGASQEGQTVCVLRLTEGGTMTLSGVEHMDPARLRREFGRRGVPVGLHVMA